MTPRPFLRAFVAPATLCALGFVAALAAVMQYSLRAYVPGSLEPGGFTLANFAALLKPLYARVFLDTVWICFLTALFTLIVGYPLAYALVHARNVALKSAILVIAVTPLFLGEVVRTYSWIVVLGNNGFRELDAAQGRADRRARAIHVHRVRRRHRARPRHLAGDGDHAGGGALAHRPRLRARSREVLVPVRSASLSP